MSSVRPVCIYPQYYCCSSHKDCRLYHICSQLPKKSIPAIKYYRKAYRVIRPVPLDKAEKRKRQWQYTYYNRLWGDLKKKECDYFQKNREYKLEYQRQYREKKNPNKHNYDSVLFEGLCDKNCENCKYDDCILPTWSNKKEYLALYRQKNIDKSKKYFREYYQKNKKARLEYQKKYNKEHREELLAKQKEYRDKNKDILKARRQAKKNQQKT